MKPKEIYYERKVSDGNYGTETIGILTQVEDGETATDVLAKVRRFVTSQAINCQAPGPRPSVQTLNDKLSKQESPTRS